MRISQKNVITKEFVDNAVPQVKEAMLADAKNNFMELAMEQAKKKLTVVTKPRVVDADADVSMALYVLSMEDVKEILGLLHEKLGPNDQHTLKILEIINN